MENIGKTIAEHFKSYAAAWAGYSAFCSFILYLLGYLVTRFELTMLGVARNLDVLEERYFFAGAKFVVYLLATIPSLLLLLLVPAAIVWSLSRLVPAQLHSRLQAIRSGTFHVTGIIFAILVIQFVARQCFVFNNLLLAPTLPGPAWLQAVLLDDQDQVAPLFFAGLVGATAITAAFLMAGNKRLGEPEQRSWLAQLLMLLLALEALLLPINYSILIAHKSFPRITEAQARPERRTWLIWENNNQATVFILPATSVDERALITVDARKLDAEKQIVAYDSLLRILFAEKK